jgi:hypothetical protein
VRLLTSALDELGTVVKDSMHAEDAEYESESRLNILAETATEGIISIDDQKHHPLPKSSGRANA